jgi:molecular chaperone IbpA
MNYGKSLLPSTIGFDRLLTTVDEFEKLFTTTKLATYPPYNIIKEDDTHYRIEVAVSGFKRHEIDVETIGNQLFVNGAISTARTSEGYLHHGIAKRDFSHKFTVADNVVVKGADLVDGLLEIKLESIIPEEQKSRKIVIGNNT